MKIYLAGSFAKVVALRQLAIDMRACGHQVFAFCDADTEVYKKSEAIRNSGDVMTFTPQTALHDTRVLEIGREDWQELSKADVVVVALPCGKSAHLEAGWAKGKRKKVCVFGPMIRGEWDAMYVMMDRVYSTDQFELMMAWMKDLDEEAKAAK